jgi:hypothetical protein
MMAYIFREGIFLNRGMAILFVFDFSRCQRVAYLLSFFVLYIIRSEFRIVVSATTSLYKRCSVRLYLQLFVEELISYLRYVFAFVY